MHNAPHNFSRTTKFASFVNGALSVVFLAMLALLAAAPKAALAQSSTTGAIVGTVTDNSGALLPNVAITVKSNDNGATRMLKSNASGEYHALELVPGSYSITYVLDGFDTFIENSVTVTVGSSTNVSPSMKVGAIVSKVEVTSDQPIMHTQSSDISTTLDQAAIDNLPINGRRWSDFALLTPGVVSNSDGYGLLSFRGISYLLNNNTVDGADDNQAYFSEARGRTRNSYSISQVAIQEFQVNTSNYSAQYGRSAGGVINTVTKSGGNAYHGEIFFYDRDNDLGGATNPYTLLNYSNGSGGYSAKPYKPTDWRKQWGFGVGGPAIRNRLFWYYAYDQSRRNFPGTAVVTDPNDIFAPSDAVLPAGETCSTSAFTDPNLNSYTEGDYNSCAIAAAFGVSYQAGSAYYQQGLGVMNSLLGTVPRSGDQVINMPKVDFQINDRNRLAVTYNRMRYSAPNGLYQPTTETTGISGWGTDFLKEDFGIARLTSVINNSLLNEALVQYGRDFEYTYQNPPAPNEVPLSHNVYNDAANIQIGYELNSGFYAGSNPDLSRAADPNEHRLQLLDSVTWSHGNHTTKFGLEFNKVYDYVNNLYNGNGSYSYDYTYTFIQDYLNAVTGIGGPNYQQLYYSFNQNFGNPVGYLATREYAGYATDDWRIMPHLTLTLGARYEYEYVPANPFYNSALPITGSRPDDRNNIAPRFGFSWDVFGKGSTVLRGGYGMYFGRIINSNILQTYEDSGAANAQTDYPASATIYPGHCGPTFPALSSPSAFASCSVYQQAAYLDPHMQNPEVHETDLSIERNIGHNMVLAVTYMGSFGRELPRGIDVNINTANSYNYTFSIVAPTSSSGSTTYPISAGAEASYSAYPQPANSGYVVLPHGGAALPLPVGASFTTKVYLQPNGSAASTRPNPAYGQILDVRSDVNSSYNALSIQLNRRFDHGFSLMTNYTWSHALDDNPSFSTVIPTFTAYDPNNLKLEYGNSSLDVRQRGVFALIYQPQTHFHGFKDYTLGGWRLAPLVQGQTGLPWTPYVTGSPSNLTVPNGTAGCTTVAGCSATVAYKGVNGSGSSADRLPVIGRNTYNYPQSLVIDFRIGKSFYFHPDHIGTTRFEIFAEVFNLMNHQNITGVSDLAYSFNTGAQGMTLSPHSTFGTYTNSNSNYTYSPRQIQLAGRLHF